ncbi:biotin synthase BioB [Candidatus Marithrix sp. Canyon 246]|uniref:biotin synthase BioB n=1 Tax=Candidatus Marithrix sp. Canyon 246 TaxID=1827136 RepID=UPI00084A2821|nr:biotin synthase BioB [Candidatus Marithrix sp. Canyon 246]
MTTKLIRHDWQLAEVNKLFNTAFNDLLFQAQSIHRQFFDPNELQLSTLLNIKTGKCSEDCSYCSQSVRFDTELKTEDLMQLDSVIAAANQAKANGATRFCMGAAWRKPKAKDLPKLLDMVKSVKALGLETCLTAGMLEAEQAQQLQQAGLDYYNHNLDTSEDYYKNIITTHSYQDRLDTLANIRNANLKTCAGGIIGLGETETDRAKLLMTLANLETQPESVPINQLVPIKGTPLGETEKLDTFEIVRCIAVARIMMPKSYVRLSAGRSTMSDELQALCFLAGANSVFYGEELLTTDNPSTQDDQQLFQRLGIS